MHTQSYISQTTLQQSKQKSNIMPNNLKYKCQLAEWQQWGKPVYDYSNTDRRLLWLRPRSTALSRRGLNPIKLPYKPSQLDGWLH